MSVRELEKIVREREREREIREWVRVRNSEKRDEEWDEWVWEKGLDLGRGKERGDVRVEKELRKWWRSYFGFINRITLRDELLIGRAKS